MRYLLLQKLIYSLPHDGNSKTCKYTLLFSHSHLFENFSCHNALMFFLFLSTLFLFFLRLCIINREHTVREKSLRFLVSLLVQNYIMWCHPFELAIKPNIRKLKINYRTKLSVFVLLFYSMCRSMCSIATMTRLTRVLFFDHCWHENAGGQIILKSKTMFTDVWYSITKSMTDTVKGSVRFGLG